MYVSQRDGLDKWISRKGKGLIIKLYKDSILNSNVAIITLLICRHNVSSQMVIEFLFPDPSICLFTVLIHSTPTSVPPISCGADPQPQQELLKIELHNNNTPPLFLRLLTWQLLMGFRHSHCCCHLTSGCHYADSWNFHCKSKKRGQH